MDKNVRYEFMRPGELEALVAERPLAWLPIGTLEWHGRHLPVGLDAIKAHAICELAARKAGGAVLPPNYFSMGGMPFPWTFKYAPAAVARTVFETLRQLRGQGFRAMIIVTGHYPLDQILMLMGVAEAFMTVSGAAAAAMPEFAMGMDRGYTGDHAAMWETSIMMELYPELVSAGEMSKFEGLRVFEMMKQGVNGANPAAHASRELGEKIVREMLDNFYALADELLGEDGRRAASDFHRKTIAGFVGKNVEKAVRAASRHGGLFK